MQPLRSPVIGEVGHEAGLIGSGVSAEHAQIPHSQRAVVAAGRQHEGRLRAPGNDIHIRRVRHHRKLRRRLSPGSHPVAGE